MNTALNEVFIGWLHENCHLGRGIFLVQEMSNFFAAEFFTYRVSFKGFGEGSGRSIPGGGNKQDQSKEVIFGKMEI